jgi:hypothetical protein
MMRTMAKVTLPGGVVIDGLTPEQATETAVNASRKLANTKLTSATAGAPRTRAPAPVRPARHVRKPSKKTTEKPVLVLKRKQFKFMSREAESDNFDTPRSTLAFLEAIKAAGSHGLNGEAVQRILETDKPKGVGGRMVRINGFLRRLGFEGTADLFDNPKDRKAGGRIWKPKRNLDVAIEAVRKVTTAH